MKWPILLSTLLWIFIQNAHAAPGPILPSGQIQACLLEADDTPTECTMLPTIWDVDPQHKNYRLTVPFQFDDSTEWAADQPLALYVSGKASSRIELNGEWLANNGTVGRDRRTEVPGRMDAMFYVPSGRLRSGENILTIDVSGHHSILDLTMPMHGVYFAPMRATGQPIPGHRLALLTAGLFVAGALYFGIGAYRSQTRVAPFLLCVMSTAVGVQLALETMRGFIAYPYPVQDLRLIGILTCSLVFAGALVAYVLARFVPEWTRKGILIWLAICALCVATIQGFDFKTLAVLGMSALASLAISGFAAIKRKPGGKALSAALGLFTILVIVRNQSFLDQELYFVVGAFLILLFLQEGEILRAERLALAEEQERAGKLALAVAAAERRAEPAWVSLKDGGSQLRVGADDIIACNASGDYVEVVLRGGRKVLHSGTMADLAAQLPDHFMRVHRSHLVNLDAVQRLDREPSGTGMLTMAEDTAVPVSRRIMPDIRVRMSR